MSSYIDENGDIVLEIMYVIPDVAPNERKSRERHPPMIDAQRACHRTRGGRGVVGTLMKRRGSVRKS